MSFHANQLYDLLPAVHRTRDAEQGFPLRQLLEVIAEQVAVLEDNLEQLYENQFVETAAPWALAYLGDLLGIHGLPSGTTARSPRAEVGHTIAYRRRKGTAPMLELLARDATGWPARAVEFFERLAATQHLNHLRLHCRSFTGLRNSRELEFLGTPFEAAVRSVEVRRVEPGLGKWNIANVGLFLWRLQSYSHTQSPLAPVGELWPGDPLALRRFRVHPRGLDVPLFVRPITEDDFARLAEPMNVSLPITYRMLAADTEGFQPTDLLYGPGLSLSLEEFAGDGYRVIPAERVVVCDLSDAKDNMDRPIWSHEDTATIDQVAIDPVRGRVVLGAAADDPRRPPRASFHLGFSFNLGGGEYPQSDILDLLPSIVAQVPRDWRALLPTFETLAEAISSSATTTGGIEITDTGRYGDALPDLVAHGVDRAISAADGRCPAILLRSEISGQPWTIRGDAEGRISLSGLWLIWPRELAPLSALEPVPALRVTGDLRGISFRHCTLASEWYWHDSLGTGGAGQMISAPNAYLEISSRGIQATIENCILPSLRVGNEGVKVHLRNCIIDSGAEETFALSNLTADGGAGSWRLENCTVIGNVMLDTLELASNCIFLGRSMAVRRRQEGCVRHSWLPANAVTPRQYRCVSPEDGKHRHVRPQFTSLRPGNPAYAQLSGRCSTAIRQGADDGAEMGALHDLYQPQREAHLRNRMAEYLRFGLESGVFYES